MKSGEMPKMETRREADERVAGLPPKWSEEGSSQAEWEKFQKGEGGHRPVLTRVRRRVRRTAPEVIALAAAAGFLVGWVVFSHRRHGGIRDVVLASLLPAASKGIHGASRGMHDAYDAVRSNKTLRDLRRRASKIKTPW